MPSSSRKDSSSRSRADSRSFAECTGQAQEAESVRDHGIPNPVSCDPRCAGPPALPSPVARDAERSPSVHTTCLLNLGLQRAPASARSDTARRRTGDAALSFRGNSSTKWLQLNCRATVSRQSCRRETAENRIIRRRFSPQILDRTKCQLSRQCRDNLPTVCRPSPTKNFPPNRVVLTFQYSRTMPPSIALCDALACLLDVPA